MIMKVESFIVDSLQNLIRVKNENDAFQQLINTAKNIGFTDSRVYLAVDCPVENMTIYALAAQLATTTKFADLGYRIYNASIAEGQNSCREIGSLALQNSEKALWVNELGLQNHEWIDIAVKYGNETIGLWSLSVEINTELHREIVKEDFYEKYLVALSGAVANQIRSSNEQRIKISNIRSSSVHHNGNILETDSWNVKFLKEIQKCLDAKFVAFFQYDPKSNSLLKQIELMDGEVLPQVQNIDHSYSIETEDSLTAYAFNNEKFQFIPFFDSLLKNKSKLANMPSMTMHKKRSGSEAHSIMYYKTISFSSLPGLIRVINRNSNPNLPFTKSDFITLKELASLYGLEVAVEQSVNLSRQTKLAADALFDLEISEEAAYQRCFEAIKNIGFSSFFLFIADHNKRIVEIYSPSQGGASSENGKLIKHEVLQEHAFLPEKIFKNSSEFVSKNRKIPQDFINAYHIPSEYRYSSFLHPEGYALIVLGLNDQAYSKIIYGDESLEELPLISALQTILEICAHGMTVRHNQEVVNDAQACVAVIAHEFRSPSKWLRSLSSTLMDVVQQFVINSDIQVKKTLKFASPSNDDKKPIIVTNKLEFLNYLNKFPSRVNLADRRLTRAVRDGLIWARTQSSVIELVFESQNISELVSSTLEEIQSDIINNRGITISVEIKHNPVITVVVDLIQGLLVNLIDNAIKYSYANTEVTLNVVEFPSFVELAISNFGTGIHKDDLPNIFTPFYRAKFRDATHPIRGVGLGLPTCRRIIEIHDGKIFAKSVSMFDDAVRTSQMEGYKTTVYVQIPKDLLLGRRDVHTT